MPVVEVVERIYADIDSVWRLVCDVDGYPGFMEPVQSVTTLSREGDESTVSWEVLLKGSTLKWTEREHRRPESYRVDFAQLDGDLERFSGYWQLADAGGGVTDAALYIDFEIGIPMLRDMLNPVAVKALRENSTIMLKSLEIGQVQLGGAPLAESARTA